jgi:hypothetical protein
LLIPGRLLTGGDTGLPEVTSEGGCGLGSGFAESSAGRALPPPPSARLAALLLSALSCEARALHPVASPRLLRNVIAHRSVRVFNIVSSFARIAAAG